MAVLYARSRAPITRGLQEYYDEEVAVLDLKIDRQLTQLQRTTRRVSTLQLAKLTG